MESGDRILVAAGLTAAVVVGAFVLWGPGGAPRTRKRKGQIAGLQNLGRTCFLNTLIQALAACPSFITWVRKYSKAGSNNSMITTLYTVLEVVNGTHAQARGTPVCPLGVLTCLRALGWEIPPEQQDAHELLHVLLSCVEEETAAMAKKPGCLSDALGLWYPAGTRTSIPSPASPPVFSARGVRSESSPATPSACAPRPSSAAAHSAIMHTTSSDEPEFVDEGSQSPVDISPPKFLQKGVSRSFCHLNQMGRGWGTAVLPARPPTPPPFNGTMATRLQCTVCSNKTPIRYDKFDSISLPLAMSNGSILGNSSLSILGLLRTFTAPELVKGVKCDKCASLQSAPSKMQDMEIDGTNNCEQIEYSSHTTHIKTLSFGKTPSCLCLHLARTQWTGLGLSKRSDHVAFSELLSLAPYTSSLPPKVDVASMLAQSQVVRAVGSGAVALVGGEAPRALYRLCAVVVHVGGPRSGHFVTYRRGNGFEANRWFYTSDTVVHEVSLEEVLKACAYMLFYEKQTDNSRAAAGSTGASFSVG